MIVPVMAILNLVLTRQIYSEETNGASRGRLFCLYAEIFREALLKKN